MSEAPLDPAAVPEATAPTPADMPTQVPEKPEERPKPVIPPELDEAMRKIRSENHELRTRLKAAEPLAKQAQEAADAKKDGEQKAIERAQAAEKREQETLEGYARLELAVQYHIEPEDIDLIGSGTREEMDSRAQRIAAKNAAAMKAAPPPTDRPMESLRPGASPEPPKPADDSYPESWKPAWMRGGDRESSIFHGQ